MILSSKDIHTYIQTKFVRYISKHDQSVIQYNYIKCKTESIRRINETSKPFLKLDKKKVKNDNIHASLILLGRLSHSHGADTYNDLKDTRMILKNMKILLDLQVEGRMMQTGMPRLKFLTVLIHCTALLHCKEQPALCTCQ